MWSYRTFLGAGIGVLAVGFTLWAGDQNDLLRQLSAKAGLPGTGACYSHSGGINQCEDGVTLSDCNNKRFFSWDQFLNRMTRDSMWVGGRTCDTTNVRFVTGRGQSIVAEAPKGYTAYQNCKEGELALALQNACKNDIKQYLIRPAIMAYQSWTKNQAFDQLGLTVPEPPNEPGLSLNAIYRGKCGAVVECINDNVPAPVAEVPPAAVALIPPPAQVVPPIASINSAPSPVPCSSAQVIPGFSDFAGNVTGQIIRVPCVDTSAPMQNLVMPTPCVTTRDVQSTATIFGGNVHQVSEPCASAPVATIFASASPTPVVSGSAAVPQSVWCAEQSTSQNDYFWGAYCCREYSLSFLGSRKCGNEFSGAWTKAACEKRLPILLRELTTFGWASSFLHCAEGAKKDAIERAQGTINAIKAKCLSGQTKVECDLVDVKRNWTLACHAEVECSISCDATPQCR